MAAEPKPSDGYDAFDQNGAREAAKPAPETEWQPSRHELLIIITLAIVSLLVALDASIIVTSLSVGPTPSPTRPALSDPSPSRPRPSSRTSAATRPRASGSARRTCWSTR